MKTTGFFLFSLLLLGVLPGTSSSANAASVGISVSGGAVDVGFFYDDLASYGNWVQRPSYGWVWRPQAVASSWRPYQRGHWVQTDDGWTWISTEPYGWATYHYGRWYQDPSEGWEWVPGNDWGPAWVSWQEGGDYIGWAPLPPAAEFRGGFGGVDFAAVVPAESYLFVPERQFLAPRLDSYYVDRGRQVDIYRQTRNITNYQVVNNRIINQGLPVQRVQQVTGHPVPHYQIADQGQGQRHQGGQVQANRVAFYRPQVKAGNVAPPPERPAARKSVVAAGTPPATPATPATVAGRAAKAQGTRQAGKSQPVAKTAPQAATETAQAAPRHQRKPAPTGSTAPAEGSQPQPKAQRSKAQRQPAPPTAERQPPPPKAERQQDRSQPAEKQPRPPQPRGAAEHSRPQGGQAQGKPQGQPQGKPQGKPPEKPKEDNPKPPPVS